MIQLEQTKIPPVDLSSSALLLDIDGTLLDIAPTPDRVFVSPLLRDTIAVLHERCGGAVAFVSSRMLELIDELFAPLTLPAVGCHGAQLRPSPELTMTADPVPAEFGVLLADIAKMAPGILVENKRFSYAIHYRLAPEAEEPICEACLNIARPLRRPDCSI